MIEINFGNDTHLKSLKRTAEIEKVMIDVNKETPTTSFIHPS